MSFPTSPTDGQIYKNYKWDSTTNLWVIRDLSPDVPSGIIISGGAGTWNWKNDIIPMVETALGRTFTFAKCYLYGSNTAWSIRYELTLNKSYEADAGGNIELIHAQGSGCSATITSIDSAQFIWQEGNCHQSWRLAIISVI